MNKNVPLVMYGYAPEPWKCSNMMNKVNHERSSYKTYIIVNLLGISFFRMKLTWGFNDNEFGDNIKRRTRDQIQNKLI